MRPSLLISLATYALLGGPGGLAQAPFDPDGSKPTPLIEIQPTPAGVFNWSSQQAGPSKRLFAPDAVDAAHPKPASGWIKNLTIESFGYDPKAREPGFELSPGYAAATWFNLQGLECPGCVMQSTRTRSTIPPFGANVTLRLFGGRVELFAGFGGLEALRPDGTFQPLGRRRLRNAEGAFTGFASGGDAWLTQIKAGAAVAVDRHRHVWIGGTARHLYNFGPGQSQWSTLSGDATFKLGR